MFTLTGHGNTGLLDIHAFHSFHSAAFKTANAKANNDINSLLITNQVR